MKPRSKSPRRSPAAAPAAPAAAQAALPATDGRLQRGARSRELVLDALLALLSEGHHEPSVQAISERAGLSRRMVFHHFRDAEALHLAVVQRQQAALRELLVEIPATLPLPTRLLRLVEQRALLYERITATRRAGISREYASPPMRRALGAFRALKRAQVESVFAPEIGSCHESVQPEIAAALGGAASFSTWEALRSHQHLGVDEAQRVLVHLLTGVLRLTPAGANLIVLRGSG
ncbi:MAG: TetR/AcrR family transcriptional regulator [Polyangia bacterium]